jgi:hypothetical protein
MDHMREQGIKRVFGEVHISSQPSAEDAGIVRVMYFANYEADCAQILDTELLARIRSGGLEKELSDVIQQRTASAIKRISVDPAYAHSLVAYVELFNDEWLPCLPPTIQRFSLYFPF